MEKRNNLYGDVEVRSYRSDLTSSDQGSRTVRGYAALYNIETKLWRDVFEVIAPGAFKNAISVSDIRLLKNHDANLILGRSKAGLRVWEDDKGLPFEGDLPETTVGNDTLLEVRSKLIDQCSFAFTVKRYEIEERKDGEEILYRILEVDRIFDVSIVTYPAYPETSVSAASKRNIESAIEEYKKRKQEIKPASQRNENILKLAEATQIFY